MLLETAAPRLEPVEIERRATAGWEGGCDSLETLKTLNMEFRQRVSDLYNTQRSSEAITIVDIDD